MHSIGGGSNFMKPEAFVLKFSRTQFDDYRWLITAHAVTVKDNSFMERIFNEYMRIPVKKSDVHYCGLVKLSMYYCYYYCYETKRKDNCGRKIYSLDALCISKRNAAIVNALYCLFMKNPQEYIQCEDIFDTKQGRIAMRDYAINLEKIFENYYAVCSEINDFSTFDKNFHPTFYGFEKEISYDNESTIEKEKYDVDIVNIANANEDKKREETGIVIYNDKNEKKYSYLLSVSKEKKILHWRFGKNIFQGRLDDNDKTFIYKILSKDKSLKIIFEDFQKSLSEKGYKIIVDKKNY